MKTNALNLFIVDDDVSILKGLSNFLSKRFGRGVIISTFNNGRSALAKIDENTHIVILDYNLQGENGNEILKSIKEINAKTEVIMLTTNEDISVAIESFRQGAKDYLIKGKPEAWRTIASQISSLVAYPVKLLVRELGVSKFLAIFMTTFLTMAATVIVVLSYI